MIKQTRIHTERFSRNIGRTTYRIGIHFSPNARETLDEKIRRLLKNDLKSAPNDGKIEPLQAGWLPERSSV